MTDRFSEDDVVTTVTRLTRARLVSFIEGDLVRPERDAGRPVYRQIDIARLELLCDLSDDLELDETTLGIVVSLIDQLHAARQDLAAIARAFDSLPDDARAGIMAALKRG